MALRKSYIEIGWKLDKSGLEQANKATDHLLDKANQASRAIHSIGNSFGGASTGASKATRQTTELANHTQEASRQAHNVATNNDRIAATARSASNAANGINNGYKAAERDANALTRSSQRTATSMERLKSAGSGIKALGARFFGLDQGLNSVTSRTRRFRDVFMGTFAGSMLTNGISMIGQGMVGSVQKLTAEMNENSKAWQTFQGNMMMAGKSTKQIKEVQGDLQDFAQKTIYSASDMASTYAQLTAVNVQNTDEVVKGFGGLAATAEEPAQAMKTLSTQATQMAAMPKVQWADLKLMMQQAPAGIAIVAKKMGGSTKDLIKNVQAGKVSSKEFLAAIAEAGNDKHLQNMATHYKTMGQAMDGFWETAANKAQDSFKSVSDVGIKAISSVTDALGNISSKDIAKGMTPVITTMSKFVKFMVDNGGSFAKIGGAMAKMVGGFAKGAWGAIATTINVLAGKGPNASHSIKNIADSMDSMSKHQGVFKALGVGLVTYFAVSRLMRINSALKGMASSVRTISKFDDWGPGSGAGGSQPTKGKTTYSVGGMFGNLNGAAKQSGQTFAKYSTRGLGTASVKSGTKFSTHAKSGINSGGTTGGQRFSYHVKSGAITAGNSGGSKFARYVTDAGSTAGSTGGSRFSSKIAGLGWASFGASMGIGAFTSKTAKGRIQGAGTAIGGAVGGYLGGPAGAEIGAFIGGAIGKKFAEQYVPATKAMSKIIDKIDDKNGKGTYKKMATNPYSSTTGPQQSKSDKAIREKLNKEHPGAGYARGTGRYPNGLERTTNAIVNDGGGKELIQLPTGQLVMGKYRNQRLQLPKGTHIYTAQDTRRLLGTRNFAGGTTKLKKQTGVDGIATDGFKKSERQTRSSMDTIAGTIESGYSKATKKSHNTIDNFNKKSNGSWKDIQEATKHYTQRVQKNTVGDYDDLQKNSMLQINQLNKQGSRSWKDLQADTKGYTNRIQRATVGDFDDMQKGSIVQMNQLHKGMNAVAKDMVSDFGSIFGKLDNYAHSAMSKAIQQLNGGIKGINVVLNKFGGSGNVLPLIHYAEGSKGPIRNHQMAVVNDAHAGPTQETIVKANGAAYMPKGRNVITPLEPGDEVLNGHETSALQGMGALPHYAKGTDALRNLIKSNNKKPGGAWKRDFDANVNLRFLGTDLSKDLVKAGRGAVDTLGRRWYGVVWDVMNDAMDDAVEGSGTRGEFLKYAMEKFTGKPYVMGATGPNAYDCSGMVMSALKKFGVNIGRTTVNMQNSGGVKRLGRDISKTRPGDLVIWGHGGGAAGHVGIIKNPKTGTMFNETPPRARVTKVSDVTSIPLDAFYRVKGLNDAKPKAKANHSDNMKSMVKKQLGKRLDWVGSHLSESDGGFGGTMEGNSITKAMIQKAMGVMKVPNGIRDRIMSNIIRTAISETGNRNIMQYASTHDVNSGGNEARGPLQFTPGTFKAFAVKGHGNVMSPYDQVLAYLNNSDYKNASGWTSIWGTRKFDWLHSGPQGHRRFAKGGHPGTAQTVLVGENGPELARFDQPATVYSNAASRHVKADVKGATGKGNVNIKLNVNVKSNGSTGKEIGKDASAEIVDSLRNLFTNELDNLAY